MGDPDKISTGLNYLLYQLKDIKNNQTDFTWIYVLIGFLFFLIGVLITSTVVFIIKNNSTQNQCIPNQCMTNQCIPQYLPQCNPQYLPQCTQNQQPK